MSPEIQRGTEFVPLTIYSGSSIETPINTDLIKKLREIYCRIASTRYTFPDQACNITSEVIESETVLTRVRNCWFTVDLNPKEWCHSWNEDESSRIYDLTAFQFNKLLYEPLPTGIIIVEPGSEMYRRYKKERLY